MADTLDFFGNELRSRGFVHITGLLIRNKLAHVAFPQNFWNKFANDDVHTTMVIRDTGHVWMKYSHSIDKTDIDWLQQQMGESTFEISELAAREPYSFDPLNFISNLWADFFALRVADPYFDFDGTCSSDPSHYYPKSHN